MSSDDALLTGATGELIERFCRALERLGAYNAEWLQLPLVGLTVDIRARVDYRNVDPSHASAVVAARALELLGHGLSEDFLVTALRNRVTAMLRNQMDLGAADQRRAEMREVIIDLHERPDLFRSRMAAENPNGPEAQWSDEEIHQQGQRLAELMSPVSADEAARVWGALDIWSKLVEQSLSDDQIDHWRQT